MNKIFSILLLTLLFTNCEKEEAMTPILQGENIPSVTTEATYNVKKVENIIYAEGLSHQSLNSNTSSRMSLELDAFIPDNEMENRPAILLIHGGGFKGGSKEVSGIVSMANFYASRGWVAFSINYRLLGDIGTVPDDWVQYAQDNLNPAQVSQFLAIYPAIRDAKAAVRWLYANAEFYKINTDYITVGGGSAGAIISTTLGITEAEDYVQELSMETDPTLSTTHLEQDSKVHSIIDLWGSGVGINIIEEVYGIDRYDRGDAPIIIVHGTEDPTVAFSEGEALRDKYISTGVNHDFNPIVGAGHGPWNATINGKTLEEASLDFIMEQQGLRMQ